MDALDDFVPRRATSNRGHRRHKMCKTTTSGKDVLRRQKKTYKMVPLDSKFSENKLKEIIVDAVWKWANENGEQGKPAEAILERLWEVINELPENTQGCQYWKNSTKPVFPYRTVCYNKTTKTCTLRNTPDKISRLEFFEGCREVLGLFLSWCHIDLLLRAICKSCAASCNRKYAGSKESIYKSQFIATFWQPISQRIFWHLAEADNDTENDKITIERMQKGLVSHSPYKSRTESFSKEGLQTESIIDPDDF